jgi:hypothetical protein
MPSPLSTAADITVVNHRCHCLSPLHRRYPPLVLHRRLTTTLPLSIANTIVRNFHLAIHCHRQTLTPTVVNSSRCLSYCWPLLPPIIDRCPQMVLLPATALVAVPVNGWLLFVPLLPHLIHLLPLCHS